MQRKKNRYLFIYFGAMQHCLHSQNLQSTQIQEVQSILNKLIIFHTVLNIPFSIIIHNNIERNKRSRQEKKYKENVKRKKERKTRDYGQTKEIKRKIKKKKKERKKGRKKERKKEKHKSKR